MGKRLKRTRAERTLWRLLGQHPSLSAEFQRLQAVVLPTAGARTSPAEQLPLIARSPTEGRGPGRRDARRREER
jgi:hypothetical protein